MEMLPHFGFYFFFLSHHGPWDSFDGIILEYYVKVDFYLKCSEMSPPDGNFILSNLKRLL